LHEKSLIEKKDLLDLKQTIKEEMPEWLEALSMMLKNYCA